MKISAVWFVALILILLLCLAEYKEKGTLLNTPDTVEKK